MNPQAATLRLAVFPRSSLLVDVLLIVAGAGLVSLAAQIEIPLGFTPVPISGQTFAVLLVGASLGPLLGAMSLLLYLGVGLVGAPVYSGGDGGWEVFHGATGGYLVGFVAAAVLTGWLAERRWDRRFNSAVAAMLSGSVVIYLFGLPWLAREIGTGLEGTLEAGLYPFVVGDLIKLYLAGMLLPGAWRLVKHLRGSDARETSCSSRGRARLAPVVASETQTQGGSMASITESIDVQVPVRTAYDQWTQFEEFPQFMEDVQSVEQIDDGILHWVVGAGVKQHAWTAEVTEQRPDELVAWKAIEGRWNAGVVTFHRLAEDETRVTVQMEHENDGLMDQLGSALGMDSRRVQGDLGRFKELVEARGEATGAWRGEIQDGERVR